MAAAKPPPADGRTAIIQAVQTPLGFFVLLVLVVEAILGVFAFRLDPATDAVLLTLIIQLMSGIIFILLLIVAIIAIWRPWVLSGKDPPKPELAFSLIIQGPPKQLPNFDITIINWDKNACFLVRRNIKERIELVTGHGPTFRVKVPNKILKSLDGDEPIALDLKDDKGNRWKVDSFYLYENLRPLSPIETLAKIKQDYAQEGQ